MDNKPQLWKDLFSTPKLKVLDFLLQNSDLELNDTEITTKVTGSKRSAINMALRELAKMGLIQRTSRGKMTLNQLVETPFIQHLKIASTLMLIQPFIEKIKTVSVMIVLFGSRAKGTNITESDIDLFIVSENPSAVRKIAERFDFEEKLQLITKLPEDWLSLSKDDAVFYRTIKEGILLWQRT